MKIPNLTPTLAVAVLLAFGTDCSMASNPTETIGTNGPDAGDVINSIYTFSNIGVNGTTATLDQTTIPNLNGVVPAVSLELVLTSMTYDDTQDTFVGTGVAPTITFDLTPTLQMADGGNLPSTQVTLVGSVIPSGQDATGVVFSLQSPVLFSEVGEMNPANLDEGTGTFGEGLSNLEPNPDEITLSGATLSTGQPIQANNQDFTFGGTVEIIYATPEPKSGWLALVAGVGIAGLALVRRKSRVA